MKILSLNVGLPREVAWQGKVVTTGIFKEPVEGPTMVRKLNLDGDRQADLTVHGGVSKAVYAYPSEHYDYWRTELPGVDLPWGMFGENLTTEGLLEDAVYIGDRFRVGETEGMVIAGDSIELIGHEQKEISVADITRLYAFEKDDVKALRRAIEVKALPENWKGYFQHQIEKQAGR